MTNEMKLSGIVRRASGDNSYPLSFAQQRLWFLDQLDPGSPTYNIPLVVQIRGVLNVPALERSLQEVINRHEVLRAIFVEVDGQPRQIIRPGARLKLTVTDWTTSSAGSRRKSLPQLINEEAQKPFNLAVGPLVRAKLWKMDAQEYTLLLIMHHVISDAWSMGVLIREVGACYDAFTKGKTLQLDELSVQYMDYAVWEQEQWQGEMFEEHLAYWRRQLRGTTPELRLPTLRTRPAVQTFRGATEFLQLPVALSDDLRALSRREGVTLFMTLLAVFQVLLHRYTGQEEITVGTPTAGRNRREVENLIGCFTNTLVLRTDFSRNLSFRQLLRLEYEVVLGAFAHQDIPFEKLVEELDPERDLSRTPFFQVMFVLHNTPVPVLELGDLTLSPWVVDHATAKFDLTLMVVDREEGPLTGDLEYNTDIFDRETVKRTLGHFETLLAAVVANPDRYLSELPLLTEVEERQLLVDFNETHLFAPRDECLHNLFAGQVARTPNDVALVCGQKQLTYRELNAMVNRLTHYLQVLGVGPEVRVGILLDRSIEMIVGMLATLKAGGAYVPMDASYPQERLTFIMEDAKVAVLLTRTHFLDQFPAANSQVVCLDSDWASIAKTRTVELPPAVTPDNLAYVIYTSGSTGKPKGVAIEHRSAATFIHWAAEVFTPEELAGVLCSTSICFDLSVFELFVPLCRGGTVILVEDVLQLPFLNAPEEIRLVNTVPSAMTELLKVEGLPESVTTVNLAGEALKHELVQNIYAQTQVKRVYNLYGPSEATTYSTYTLIERGTSQAPSIGRPVSGTQVYLLDQQLRPVPIGVVGEIYIGGAGLARGYLARPELTAEAFIPNPFSPQPGRRLYRTGDVGRYRADGNIEFLGRKDQQVKIRGYRIELDEIESVLRRHPSLSGAVVLAQEVRPSERRLIGYVVANSRPAPSTDELRSFLLEKLPGYMVPQAFIELNAFPLTPNGKIDRRALPQVEQHHLTTSVAFVAPRNDVEHALAAIWEQVLGLKQVGVYDNFFRLGGDSILSLQIVSRANRAGLHLFPRQLFKHQTVADLASVAGTEPGVHAEQGLVIGSLPLTPIQQWFLEQQRPDRDSFNQSALLKVKPGLKPAVIEEAIEKLLFHHDALRLRFRHEHGAWKAEIIPAETGEILSLVDCSNLTDETLQRTMDVSIVDAMESLHLEKGPLTRAIFFDRGNGQPAYLFMVIHHLAVDGVSWRILLEDLHMACEQISQNEEITLPPKTSSYKLWAERLQDYARSPEVDQELSYWLAARRKQVSPLPTDFPGNREEKGPAQSLRVSLGEVETRALLHEIPQLYQARIDDVLLTALVEVIGEWTGQRRLLVDLEGHGREDIFADLDVTRTVGWFTTIYPVVVETEGTDSDVEALEHVRDQIGRIPHRGLGYGVLKYLRDDDRSKQLLESTTAEVSFNYLGQFDQVLSEGQLFSPVVEASDADEREMDGHSHLLEINGSVIGGRLQMEWRYRADLYARETIKSMGEMYVKRLGEMLANGLNKDLMKISASATI